MTPANQHSTVVGVFEDRGQARQAVDELRRAGFTEEQIGLAARRAEAPEVTEQTGSRWEEGAVAGAITGAGVGGLIGLGILAGVIPGLGPAIAGGTLAVLLANAAGGAAVASIIGALIGLGIPEEEARWYEGEFTAGRTLVTVRADGRADEAVAILRRHGGYDMGTRPTTHRTVEVPVRRADVFTDRPAVSSRPPSDLPGGPVM